MAAHLVTHLQSEAEQRSRSARSWHVTDSRRLSGTHLHLDIVTYNRCLCDKIGKLCSGYDLDRLGSLRAAEKTALRPLLQLQRLGASLKCKMYTA